MSGEPTTRTRGPRPPRSPAGRYHLRAPAAIAAMHAIDAALAPLRPRHAPAPPAEPARILVANWAQIGDLLLSLPALAALRARHPRARIDLLTSRAAAPLALASGLIDHVHRLDHWALDRSGRPLAVRMARYLRDAAAMRRTLAAVGYDLSIDLYGWFPNTALLCRAAGIAVRIGFDSGGGGALLTHPVRWPAPPVHVSDAPRALLQALDPEWTWGPLMPCWPGPIAPASSSHPPGHVLVHTGTGEPSREWPEAHWIAVLRSLKDAALPVCLAGAGARERDRAARLAAAVPGIVDATGTDWPAFAALVRDARLVVCLESSCAHVAAALARPTVCLFGHANDPVLWGPRNPRAVLVRPPRGGDGRTLAGLEPDAVVAAMRAVLAADTPAPTAHPSNEAHRRCPVSSTP